VKLAGEQLVLDTNILVHWLRANATGVSARESYALDERRPRPVVPVVVRGELLSLSTRLGWGEAKVAALDALIRKFPVLDISSDEVIAAYARIDATSLSNGRKMGKNDLWIAAIASVVQGYVLTADADFDHLDPDLVRVEHVVTVKPHGSPDRAD
jgi:tRNA(fMet)-specific endonuclease VapC